MLPAISLAYEASLRAPTCWCFPLGSSWGPGEWAQAITAAAALAAAIIGPFAAFRIASRQIAADIVSANRAKWIEALRREISLAVTLARQLRAARISDDGTFGGKSKDDLVFPFIEKITLIELMLNPTETTHQAFLKKLASTRVAIKDDTSNVQGVMVATEELIQSAQALLKHEWERVKSIS